VPGNVLCEFNSGLLFLFPSRKKKTPILFVILNVKKSSILLTLASEGTILIPSVFSFSYLVYWQQSHLPSAEQSQFDTSSKYYFPASLISLSYPGISLVAAISSPRAVMEPDSKQPKPDQAGKPVPEDASDAASTQPGKTSQDGVATDTPSKPESTEKPLPLFKMILVTASIQLCMFLVALDRTIVSTVCIPSPRPNK
jgi:hypothetical protein